MTFTHKKNLKVGLDAFYGINCSADYYYHNNRYSIKDRGGPIKSEDYLHWIEQVSEKYSLLSIADVFHKDEWDNWRKLHSHISDQTYIFANSMAYRTLEDGRIESIGKENAATTISFQPYIHGTITRALNKIKLIRSHNLSISVIPQSEESSDSFLSDFAVGVQSEFIQFGGLMHMEQISKYNRLWHIDRFELKQKTNNNSEIKK